MTRLRLLVVAALVPLALAGAAHGAPLGSGEETYDCGLLAVDESGAATCAEESSGPQLRTASFGADADDGEPGNCRFDGEVVVWAGSDWLRIAGALGADRSPCGDAWVAIPPLAANKTGLRVLQDDAVRALGVHPVAEFTVGALTGWGMWVKNNQKTWFEAGVEFRRRMAAAGYSGPDETWLLNELDRSTMRDAPRQVPPEPDVPPARRADMVQLFQGLYYGALGMDPLPGVVDIGINFRHQNIPNVPEYKRELQAWLEDSAFWTAIAPAVRWFGVEVYADTRNWGVSKTSLKERRWKLEEYQQHLIELLRNGPPSTAAAQELFERAYVPLFNGGYRARGGDQFQFVTGHGNTIVPAETMVHFVSEQVFAIRHYAGWHRHEAPAGRIGFSWQPCNRKTAEQAGCDPVDATFVAELDAISARLAESIRYAYGPGNASAAAACGPPKSGVDWCRGEVPGAAFTDAWRDFGRWD